MRWMNNERVCVCVYVVLNEWMCGWLISWVNVCMVVVYIYNAFLGLPLIEIVNENLFLQRVFILLHVVSMFFFIFIFCLSSAFWCCYLNIVAVVASSCRFLIPIRPLAQVHNFTPNRTLNSQHCVVILSNIMLLSTLW